MHPVRLETPRVVLRELRAEDWPALVEAEGDPRVARFLPRDPLDGPAAKARLATSMLEAEARPRRLYDLALTEGAADRLVGRVVLRLVRPEHFEAEVGFTLNAQRWGQGLMTDAVRALIGFGFERLGLHRIYGDCDPRNVASARVMEKVGMRREAHLRENWWLKGEWCDAYIYGVLAHEWPPRR